MKSGAVASALIMGGLFASSVVGHPLNVKRDLVTEVVYVTQTIADAVVYVDEDGVPYSTSTVANLADVPKTVVEPTPVSSSTPTSAPIEPAPKPTISLSVEPKPSAIQVSSTTSSATARAQEPSPPPSTPPSPPLPSSRAPEPPVSKVPAPAPAPAPSSKVSEPHSSPAPRPSTSSDDSFPVGITYDPFKGTSGQTQCKSNDEMTAEFEQMKSYGIMRIYGNDCGVIPVAVQQAKKNGQVLMAGIYSPNQVVSDVVNALSDAIKKYNGGDWSIIKVVSVENERVNAHVITASDAQDTISQARAALNSAGYSGPVGVVETAPAVIDNPSLCEKSDLTLVNIHAFFDPNTKAENAGEFVKSEVERVQKACPNKRVVVTESGWPSQGTSHDQAVVSKDAQRAAIASIKKVFDRDLFFFSAFDSLWKTDDPSTWNSERYWGILDGTSTISS